jgi:hypothetical protein
MFGEQRKQYDLHYQECDHGNIPAGPAFEKWRFIVIWL